jgi:hypothetical protein
MRHSRIRATRPPCLLRFAKLGPAYGLVLAQHERPDPVHVRLVGPDALVLAPDPGAADGVVRHPTSEGVLASWL